MVTAPPSGGQESDRLGRVGDVVDTARARLGDLAPLRVIRIGVVGFAALAVLSGASYATRVEVAVPAERTASAASTTDYTQRDDRIDRSNRDTARPTPPPAKTSTSKKATPKKAGKPVVVGTRYTRVDLNVRADPSENGKLITVLDTGSKLKIADPVKGQWQSIVHDGELGWVKKRYLVSSKPNAISSSACATGSSVESGLTRDAIAVHRAVCARFPQITSYGGVRADSLPEHPSGRALDCMLGSSGTGLGWEIANWLRANAGRLGISQILFDQRIWTAQRGGEGWRMMSSRGGATADHRDHVHVTVYGNAS